MRGNRVSACVFAATLAAGCLATGDAQYGGAAWVGSPDLIEVSPGVQVVADADEPLFYTTGYYWVYRDGYWLRSTDYRRGFTRVAPRYVPHAVRSIDRPHRYVHYRRHHGGDYRARANTPPPRSRPAPTRWSREARPVPTRPRVSPPFTSPSDVRPSTPRARPGTPPPTRWSREARPVPTRPRVTPPITSPSDVRPRGPDRGMQGRRSPSVPRNIDRAPRDRGNRATRANPSRDRSPRATPRANRGDRGR